MILGASLANQFGGQDVMSLAFVFLLLVVIAAAFSLATLSLYGINQLYKIQGNSLRRSALVVLIPFLTGGIVSLLAVQLSSIAALLHILAFLAAWAVVYFLYKHYFQATVGKFLAVFATYNALWLGLAVLVALPVRHYVLEPVQLQTDSMTPAFQRGEYIFFEKWDKVPRKGDVVLVSIPCPNRPGTCVGVRRVSAVAGDVVNGTQVPNGAYLIATDNQSSKSVEVKANAVRGKLFLDLGQTGRN
jgi:signal peptidase I